ncbi:unnamed protein product [Mesocestoides corti]|uniref:Uncharacterized protein n=1 Tax=Mesocestoides corti TaxID=53468 RepID=A0A158QUB4_MESCO|nr:unnamed protein product [Mesocestoides corti]
MTWNGTPVSLRSVPKQVSHHFSRNPKILYNVLQQTNAELYWLSQLRHPNILLLLGVTFLMPQSMVPSLVVERVYSGCLNDVIKKENLFEEPTKAQLGSVSEGESNSSLSSISPNKQWIRSEPSKKLSDDEIVCLAPWLAPEVVVFSRCQGQIGLAMQGGGGCGGGAGDSAYQSILGGDCVPSPASDTFGIARVMQELLDPLCAPRFNSAAHSTTESASDTSRQQSILARLRPALKNALRRDPSSRGPIENLHEVVLQAGRVLEDQQSPSKFDDDDDHGSRHRYDSAGLRRNVTTPLNSQRCHLASLYALQSLASRLKNDNACLEPLLNREEGRGTSTMDCVTEAKIALLTLLNLVCVAHAISTVPPRTTPICRASSFQLSQKTETGPWKKEIRRLVNRKRRKRHRAGPRKRLTCMESCLLKPLTFSSPIPAPQRQCTSLTKEQYIELVAIPSGPLGPGRARPTVPWKHPSAPAPTPSASSSSTLASSSELVAGWRSLVDDTGNWADMDLDSKKVLEGLQVDGRSSP